MWELRPEFLKSLAACRAPFNKHVAIEAGNRPQCPNGRAFQQLLRFLLREIGKRQRLGRRVGIALRLGIAIPCVWRIADSGEISDSPQTPMQSPTQMIKV